MNPYSPPAPAAQLPAPPLPYAPGPGGVTSDGAIEELRQARPWIIFMSVVTFLESGLTLLGAVSMFAAAALIPVGMGAAAGAPVALGGMMGALYGGMGLFYLCIAGAYVYPALKLWSFGSAVGRLVVTRSAADLEDALRQQKFYWKFLGIAVIALFVFGILFAVAMVVAIAAGVAKAAS